jgi:hypothetical protein
MLVAKQGHRHRAGRARLTRARHAGRSSRTCAPETYVTVRPQSTEARAAFSIPRVPDTRDRAGRLLGVS